ncbi:hypothetical protein EYF80_017455 [Liparis tanakae]|uniref:Uncharacterized protein n=1 Tax=Liparis tanakae TaxID=230148 RepID=A0A4Z2I4Z4_9TELE|nr:hypothetical protein EYF80_017455 [Liparis tanakae]
MTDRSQARWTGPATASSSKGLWGGFAKQLWVGGGGVSGKCAYDGIEWQRNRRDNCCRPAALHHSPSPTIELHITSSQQTASESTWRLYQDSLHWMGATWSYMKGVNGIRGLEKSETSSRGARQIMKSEKQNRTFPSVSIQLSHVEWQQRAILVLTRASREGVEYREIRRGSFQSATVPVFSVICAVELAETCKVCDCGTTSHLRKEERNRHFFFQTSKHVLMDSIVGERVWQPGLLLDYAPLTTQQPGKVKPYRVSQRSPCADDTCTPLPKKCHDVSDFVCSSDPPAGVCEDVHEPTTAITDGRRRAGVQPGRGRDAVPVKDRSAVFGDGGKKRSSKTLVGKRSSIFG